MAGKPWFEEKGLRFECTQCGDCCTGAPGFVWVNQEEIEAIAKAISVDVDEFEKKYVRKIGIRKSLVEFPNGDCVFFDTEKRNCSVYEARPRQCRTWPWWNSNINSEKAWEETKEACPGCGKGKLFTAEHILNQAAVIRI
jgi:Fe-S-cluster containining protein